MYYHRIGDGGVLAAFGGSAKDKPRLPIKRPVKSGKYSLSGLFGLRDAAGLGVVIFG